MRTELSVSWTTPKSRAKVYPQWRMSLSPPVAHTDRSEAVILV